MCTKIRKEKTFAFMAVPCALCVNFFCCGRLLLTPLAHCRNDLRMLRLFVHLLAIVSLVLATASPACAFIAGQGSMIRICGADGHMKTVMVPAALDPMAPLEGEQNTSGVLEDCPFCLAFNTLKGNTPSVFTIIPAPQPEAFARSGPGSIVFAKTPALGFDPTGPPVHYFM